MTKLTDLSQPSLPVLNGLPKKLLIGGKWVEASTGRTFPSINPSTGLPIADIAEGDAKDVDEAVTAARSALEGPWRRASAIQRQNVLLALADVVADHYEELHLLEALEMGRPVGTADLQTAAQASVEGLRYYAGWTTKISGGTLPNSVSSAMLSYTLKEPVGVVASIIPWNGPLGNALWKIGPVLATGCTMILKPSEEASLTAIRLGELLCEVGLPDGVVNVVTGFGHTVGSALAEHSGVDKVAFTGSSQTGQTIVRAAAGNLKRVSLELGGKSPDVIFADADLSRAIPGAAMGVFWNSGQVCCAGTRVFVERVIYDDVLSGMAEVANSLVVGNSLDPSTQIGPLVSARQLSRVTDYLDIGREEGARVIAGGERLTTDDLADGYFVPPTVFADVSDGMRVAREEIFGPVACVMPFDDTEEVVARANDTAFGLGAGVWTSDVGKAHRLAREMRSGTVWINTYLCLDPAVPFGGYKMSGWGRELGPDSLEAYLNVKSVWIDTDV